MFYPYLPVEVHQDPVYQLSTVHLFNRSPDVPSDSGLCLNGSQVFVQEDSDVWVRWVDHLFYLSGVRYGVIFHEGYQ